MTLALLVPLLIDPYSLVRVDDPAHPDAITHSDAGAVLLAPPAAGTRWESEDIAIPDRYVAEEAMEALRTAPWHDSGFTGAGVKIAVFDIQWFSGLDLEEELGSFTSHDCFSDPTCAAPIDPLRPTFRFEQGGHGIACAEVVRDLAPEAELHLVRTQGRTTLENAVAWAIREQIDIISMSVSFLNSSMHDGSGPISAMAHDLAAGGVLLVTSAGNYADSHWGGPWVDGDRDGRLDFDGDNSLWVYQAAGEQSLLVQWDQRMSCGMTDLDLRMVSEDGALLGFSDERQLRDADRCQPYERITTNLAEPAWVKLEVHLRRGVTVDLDVDILSTAGSFYPIDPEGSIADPAASPHALAVGAVRATGYLDNDVESFSSWGSRTGSVPKPDLVGPDGLSTANYGARGFYGTSASTPAVAAAIALVMSANPGMDAFEAAELLKAGALGGEPVWAEPDPALGAGKVRLGQPVLEPLGCTRGGRALVLALPLLLFLRRRRAAN